MLRLYFLTMAVGLTLSVAAGTANAQQAATNASAVRTSLGVRGGLTLDADSFNGGLHANLDGVGGLVDLANFFCGRSVLGREFLVWQRLRVHQPQ